MQPSDSDHVLAGLDRRPAPWIRGVVLAGAIACLALTMCHSEKTAQRPPANATQPAQQAAPDPGTTAQPGAPHDPGPPKLDPRYFSATKAPASLR